MSDNSGPDGFDVDPDPTFYIDVDPDSNFTYRVVIVQNLNKIKSYTTFLSFSVIITLKNV